ncbi:hypothetical protein N9B63_04715 [Akkermansiaceae bacterium]|nr:hypothetical protein [Akkermansiaceae bacterium]
MRPLLACLALFLLIGCEEFQQDTEATLTTSEFPAIVAPLIDPAKLDSLKGKRAATPRLRKTCYWLEMARREGNDLEIVLDEAHTLTGAHKAERVKTQKDSLIRNVTILERLGCLDEAGMIKLRKGNAPTITKGPYAGEIVTGDHIIPRSVTPELDNTLFNLEFMPLTLNQQKSAKIGQRQIDLARRWNKAGLLSKEGLRAVIKSKVATR